uniref:GTPase Era, mitochondrial n=1 Tax=Lepisosteus oculatus TaxID=7918 RepID=W5M6A3_LEPOC|nr:PREDICTED: GTPase Era, mitochondrial [Lepisosteus oculatus]
MSSTFCISLFRKTLRFASSSVINAPLFLKSESARQTVVRLPVCCFGTETALDSLVGVKAGESDDGLCHRVPSVSPSNAEHRSLLINRPNQPVNPKVLRVAVIGAPNAGKSTLSNQLLGRKVFPVSQKVHTTRSSAQGIITDNDTQLILLDTPGLTTPSKVKKHQLEQSLLVDPWDSVQEANLVLVLVDVSDHWTRSKLSFEVLKCLASNPHIPSVLVLNKVDLLKNKSMLLDIATELTGGTVNGRKLRIRSVLKPETGKRDSVKVEPRGQTANAEIGAPEPEDREVETSASEGPAGPGQAAAENVRLGDAPKGELSNDDLSSLRSRHGWPHFRDVFMLSAIEQGEVETLKRYLVLGAKPGPWQYHSDVLTDQSPEEICGNAVREKLLEYLPQEVPYNISQTIEMWEEGESGELKIYLKMYVKKESHMKMVIGHRGQVINRIAREAAEDLKHIFLCEVKMRISIKVKK